MNNKKQIKAIFNGKNFYQKQLLLDKYVDSSRKLLTAILENNENKQVTFRCEQNKIIKNLLNLKN